MALRFLSGKSESTDTSLVALPRSRGPAACPVRVAAYIAAALPRPCPVRATRARAGVERLPDSANRVSDQVVREYSASRGTEASAEVLVGPPGRMVSNAGQQRSGTRGRVSPALCTRTLSCIDGARRRPKPQGTSPGTPPGDSTPAPPPSTSSVGVGEVSK
jgi:hypothetical protein